MVLIYLSRGEKKRARETANELAREAPNDPGVHFQRGVIARLDGDYEKALRCFERMARLSPADQVVASYNRSRIFTYQGRYEEALAELDEGAAVEPDHPLIRAFRAQVLYYRGEEVKAAEMLEQVLEQQPQLDGIRPIYATFLSALGFNEEAREQISAEVIKTADTDHDVDYWLASAYDIVGDREDALRWLRRAVESGK